MDIEVGDRVTFDDGSKTILNTERDIDIISSYREYKPVKIERPNWKVVEEKKELLTEEEREFLRLYMTINKIRADKIKFNIFEVNFMENGSIFTAYINTESSFRNLDYGVHYSLKELRIGGINGRINGFINPNGI